MGELPLCRHWSLMSEVPLYRLATTIWFCTQVPRPGSQEPLQGYLAHKKPPPPPLGPCRTMSRQFVMSEVPLHRPATTWHYPVYGTWVIRTRFLGSVITAPRRSITFCGPTST